MDRETMKPILEWLEEVPFTRESCLRNITREFSDGHCVAEIIHFFAPKLIDMNVYSQISATPQKLKQWETLSKKVLKKLDCEPPIQIVKMIVDMRPGAAELLLRNLKLRIQQVNRPERCGARFSTEIYARGCHWFPRLFA
jgi:hypothetical protein